MRGLRVPFGVDAHVQLGYTRRRALAHDDFRGMVERDPEAIFNNSLSKAYRARSITTTSHRARRSWS